MRASVHTIETWVLTAAFALLGALLILIVFGVSAYAAESLDEDGWETVIDCPEASVKHYHLSDVSLYRVETSVGHGSHYQHRRRPRMPIITFDAEKLTLKINGKLCGRWK